MTLTAANALTRCNACEIEDAHDGCEAGYCLICCPRHGIPAGYATEDAHLDDLEA